MSNIVEKEQLKRYFDELMEKILIFTNYKNIYRSTTSTSLKPNFIFVLYTPGIVYILISCGHNKEADKSVYPTPLK